MCMHQCLLSCLLKQNFVPKMLLPHESCPSAGNGFRATPPSNSLTLIMYILINLERHKPMMGDIVSHLVTNYGVPLSIVDSVEKLCPNCGVGKASTAKEKLEDSKDTPLVLPHSAPRKTPTPPATTCSPHSDRPVSVKSEVRCEEFDEWKPSSSVSGSATPTSHRVIESAIAQALQTNSLLQSVASDEGSSSSVIDDEEMANNLCLNPELLASFISSTPSIFSTNGTSFDLSQSISQKINCCNGAKRELPKAHEVNGKVRRGRIVYTQKELDILEKYYNEDANACADPVKRRQLCSILEVDYHRLKVWFQNRRRKDKLRTMNDEEMNSAALHETLSSLL
ncbi:unnamed protein product [Caenorhabditis auriculariae]|uniref:Homeobox domain-containing protein n=1 Tax=Caenorhabditis auriculariae TaxID=2777116 RepID=A0A8S1H8W2_9PELO|nr:unnamed protein product [Caenorhabditis auriculariae]